MAEKPIEDARSKSSEAANQKRSPRTSQSDGTIRSAHNRTIDQTDQSSRVHQDEKARRLSNQIRLSGSKADASSYETEASTKPITAIGQIIFGRIIFGRTFFGWIILRSETPKIGTSHEWLRTARVTRSTSPLDYDTSSKETVRNGGRS